MKRYKLKRDLPTFKAGDEFSYINGSLIECKPNGTTGICLYSANTLEKFPNILIDWFEEVKEPTRWKPEMGQAYYYIRGDGSVYDDTWVNDCAVDNGRFEIGNIFQTREEAERVVEYLEALAIVRGDATSKFTKGCRNWRVYYDSVFNYLAIESNFSDINNGIFGLPYFATEDDAQRSIKLHKKEWLTIFGVEDKNEIKK